jgi:hypothetical protein
VADEVAGAGWADSDVFDRGIDRSPEWASNTSEETRAMGDELKRRLFDVDE